MRFNRVITLAVIAAISATLVSCDDDNNNEIPGAESVLPTSIVTSYSNEEEKESISFKYNETGNDTTSIIGFSRSWGNEEAIPTEYSVVYSNGQVVALKRDNEIVYTYETALSASASETSQGNTTRLITKKNAWGEVAAYITINSNNQVISYTEDPEDDETREISAYTYSGKNISKVTYTEEADASVVTTYSYNSNNGIFKNVTTPQWFIITELTDDFVLIGQINNCVSKLTGKFENKTETVAVTYQSYNTKGFPTKFSVKYNDMDENEEVTQQHLVSYNIAK